MPDLDLIKQGKQGRGTGAGGFPRAGRARPRGRYSETSGAGIASIAWPPTSQSRFRSIPESILVRGRRYRPSA